jgi:hypothetical protein
MYIYFIIKGWVLKLTFRFIATGQKGECVEGEVCFLFPSSRGMGEEGELRIWPKGLEMSAVRSVTERKEGDAFDFVRDFILDGKTIVLDGDGGGSGSVEASASLLLCLAATAGAGAGAGWLG